MTEAGKNSLFQFPGIGIASFQHVATVVGFDHDRGATTQPLANECRDVAKVHQGGDLHPLMRRREPEIVYGVVWDGEGVKVDLADAKVAARLYLLDAVLKRPGAFAWFFIVNVETLADVGIAGFGGNIDRAIDCPKQYAQAAGVVAMFMGDEDGIESLHVFADEREPARNLFGAQSGVHENTSLACNDQNRIAR